MARVPHGGYLVLEDVEAALESVRSDIAASPEVAAVIPALPLLTRMDYLFRDVQGNPDNLLPVAPMMNAALKKLGLAMHDNDTAPEVADAIPAIYTYFGQFVDHDITREAVSNTLIPLMGGLFDPAMTPLTLDQIRDKIKNTRTATLDLDSLYDGDSPRSADGTLAGEDLTGQRMAIGKVVSLGGATPPTQRPQRAQGDDFNDLPRKGDKLPRIGDGRNDENTIVAQLHLAFLRAHNALVDQSNTFDQARTILRQHYQWVVIHDFLKRIVGSTLVDDILAKAEDERFYHPDPDNFFLPFEYSVAAYRFGHTMVRTAYDFNVNFIPTVDPVNDPRSGSLIKLFQFTGAGDFAGLPVLPDNWIIEWDKFVDGGTNPVRPLDTHLVEPLRNLPEFGGVAPEASLAVRNLLRGYLLRMPTGQALAAAMGIAPMTPAEITAVAQAAGQGQIFVDHPFLAERTPLWYYILAEASAGGGLRLGPVGGTIVAEVLIELVRRSEDSILQVPGGWTPTLPAIGEKFILEDILALAGVHTPVTATMGA